MERKAMCPGSFDPVTNGHVDIISRTAAIFDEVVATVFANPNKDHLLPLDERMELVEGAVAHIPNVVVERGDGLLVECARRRGINVIIKGLRAVSDFEYEFQMAQTNRALGNAVETLFMMARPEHAYLSSSLVKELATHGADIGEMVPPAVQRALEERRKTTGEPSASGIQLSGGDEG